MRFVSEMCDALRAILIPVLNNFIVKAVISIIDRIRFLADINECDDPSSTGK